MRQILVFTVLQILSNNRTAEKRHKDVVEIHLLALRRVFQHHTCDSFIFYTQIVRKTIKYAFENWYK